MIEKIEKDVAISINEILYRGLNEGEKLLADKINEIIDYINSKEE